MDSIIAIPLPGQPPGPGGGENSPPALPEFLAGPENRLVPAAVRSVLDDPSHGYDPLVFCGPSGTGKSHLARGLAAQWKARHQRSRVLCTTAADFGRELAEAVETQALDEFRNRYRKAALLVLEDVDRLAGEDDVQGELVHTLDALLATGRRVVVTAVATPARLPHITPRFQSRLNSGLTVSLAPPVTGTRLAVLQRLARLRNVKLSASAAQMLAEGLPATVPELFDVLAELEVQARLHGGRIDAGAARSFLALRAGSAPARLRDIAATTARSFALRLSELRGPSRRQAVVTARAVAMYMARRFTSKSLEQIGRYFGGRDHTTVMYGCRKTEKLLKTDPAVSQAVQQLQE
ncbi:MAG: DnaA ATPase domain-containing protein, partial [Planctomycetota bacterium]